MIADIPDDCVVIGRLSLEALSDENDRLRKKLQQALARIKALESRLAPQPETSPDLFTPCYNPPGWVDPDTDPDTK